MCEAHLRAKLCANLGQTDFTDIGPDTEYVGEMFNLNGTVVSHAPHPMSQQDRDME